jgi:hypothetical protein
MGEKGGGTEGAGSLWLFAMVGSGLRLLGKTGRAAVKPRRELRTEFEVLLSLAFGEGAEGVDGGGEAGGPGEAA